MCKIRLSAIYANLVKPPVLPVVQKTNVIPVSPLMKKTNKISVFYLNVNLPNSLSMLDKLKNVSPVTPIALPVILPPNTVLPVQIKAFYLIIPVYLVIPLVKPVAELNLTNV